jgi:DNA-binding MarR family transcriptional regulator
MAQRVSWSFLTNHAQVLVCIAHDPGVRLREIAEAVGITERAAQRIVGELSAAGYVSRRRIGRRNH